MNIEQLLRKNNGIMPTSANGYAQAALAIRKAICEEIEGMKHDSNDYDYEAALSDVQAMLKEETDG